MFEVISENDGACIDPMNVCFLGNIVGNNIYVVVMYPSDSGDSYRVYQGDPEDIRERKMSSNSLDVQIKPDSGFECFEVVTTEGVFCERIRQATPPEDGVLTIVEHTCLWNGQDVRKLDPHHFKISRDGDRLVVEPLPAEPYIFGRCQDGTYIYATLVEHDWPSVEFYTGPEYDDLTLRQTVRAWNILREGEAGYSVAKTSDEAILVQVMDLRFDSRHPLTVWYRYNGFEVEIFDLKQWKAVHDGNRVRMIPDATAA